MRTIMAGDRTLMAWLHTSMSLLTFCYTIYKILEEFRPSENPTFVTPHATPVCFLSWQAHARSYWISGDAAGHSGCCAVLIHSDPARPSLVMSIIMASVGMLCHSVSSSGCFDVVADPYGSPEAGAVALLWGATFLWGGYGRARYAVVLDQSVFTSLGAGTSIAYVFVHIMYLSI